MSEAMGAGATAAPKLTVNDTETLVVEIGKDGEAIERGTDLPIDKVQQIFIVIDPRAGNAIWDCKCLNDPARMRKLMCGGGGKTTVKVFVLVPSSTSSKALMLNAHMGSMYIGHWLQQEPCFIRVDDYYTNGDAIMKAMVEQGKRVYPVEEASNMKLMLEAVEKYLAPKCAYMHWAIGKGLEMEECFSLEKVAPILDDADVALGLLGDPAPADVIPTSALIATYQRAVFWTFSEDSAAKFADSCGDAFMVTVKEEYLKMAEFDELDGELGGCANDEAHPVMLAGPSDLAWGVDAPSLFVRMVSKWREVKPEQPMVVILADENVDAFKQNLSLVPALNYLVENADMVIFVANSEVKNAVDFFTKAKYPEAAVARQAMNQLIPFPRLHFYTLGTAIGGADLEDGEIFLPAVTVGPAGGNGSLPATEKFRTTDNCFIFPDFSNHERVVPGADGFDGTSLILPATLLCSIFQSVCENMASKCGDSLSWSGAFDAEFSGLDDNELVEASSNIQDLCSEIAQYKECSIDEGE